MRIVVINTAASSGGALSILKDFYQYVRETDTLNDWIFILSGSYVEETDNITVKVINNSKNKINRLKFDNFNGHRLINRFKPDLVFSMQNTTIAKLSVPQFLYLHQSIPFQQIKKHSFFRKEEFKFAVIQFLLGRNIKYGLKRADKIIVQTNWMKDAVLAQGNIESNTIKVIPPSINIDEEKKTESSKVEHKNFFYPSASAPYKNNALIDQACNYIDSKYPNLQYRIDITVNDKFENKHISSIGKISREKVFEKMREEVIIFPSFIETFGLPLAEGRALNSIIFASDTPFSREILSEYENAYFFDPFNKKELSELLVRSIKGEIVRKPQTKDYSVSDNSWERVCNIFFNLQ